MFKDGVLYGLFKLFILIGFPLGILSILVFAAITYPNHEFLDGIAVQRNLETEHSIILLFCLAVFYCLILIPFFFHKIFVREAPDYDKNKKLIYFGGGDILRSLKWQFKKNFWIGIRWGMSMGVLLITATSAWLILMCYHPNLKIITLTTISYCFFWAFMRLFFDYLIFFSSNEQE